MPQSVSYRSDCDGVASDEDYAAEVGQIFISLATFANRWASLRTVSVLPENITHTQLTTLYLIRRGVNFASDLASRLQVTPTVVSALLNRLERQGYIERVPDSIDRRRTILNLTESGHELSGSAERIILQPLTSELARLSLDDLAAMAEGLRVISDVLGNLDPAILNFAPNSLAKILALHKELDSTQGH